MSPRRGDVEFPRRGQASCFHQWEQHALGKAVEPLFLQAVDLLPVDEMPVLLRCVVGGGACFGLLDPVTNIVLNAVSYLDRLERPTPEELFRRSRLFPYQQQRLAEDNRMQESVDMGSFRETWLRFAAGRSRHGLAVFMENYFRYLTTVQAASYLEFVGFDLALAVHLVHHDRFTDADQLPCAFVPDPSSNRTLAALKLAALEARLWAPADDYVLLATSRYPRDLLEEATAPLLRRQKLSRDDVNRMLNLMRWRSDKGPGGDDRNHAPLTVLRRPEDMASMLSSCLQSAPVVPRHGPPPSHPADCGYTRYLKPCLVDAIHVFYLEALSRLPTAAARRHIRGVLVSGHCYGPMDPVSNILLNSIWYDTVFPPPVALAGGDNYTVLTEGGGDVLDNNCLLRMERRSLAGLVAFLGATVLLPEHEAVEYLCYKQCNLSDIDVRRTVHAAPGTHQHNPFVAAAEAAKHPQHAALGTFLASLAPENLDRLRSLLNPQGPDRCTVLPDAAVEQIYDMLRGEHPSTSPISLPVSVPEPLCPEASWTLALAEKKEAFRNQHRFFQGMLRYLLRQYAASHPEEPRYDLDMICGASASEGFFGWCYHVNFLASAAVPVDESPRRRTFFFAEFSLHRQRHGHKPGFRRHESEPAFCCPVALSADLGRCFKCESKSSRILHPATVKYRSNQGKDTKSSTHPFGYRNSRADGHEAPAARLPLPEPDLEPSTLSTLAPSS